MRPTNWQERVSRQGYLRHLQEIRVTDREIAGYLRDSAIEAERMVERTLGQGIGARVRREQYRMAAFALRQQQRALWGHVSSSTLAGLRRTSAVSAATSGRLGEFLARVSVQEGIPRAGTLLDTFREASLRTGEQVRSRYLNDIQLSPRVYRNENLSLGRVDRVVNRGIALGKSSREIAKDVRFLIRPDTPGGVSYAAMRLGRTELNNAFHATTLRTHAQLPFTTGMKWNLSGSHPRTDACDDLASADHDQLGSGVFRMENVPAKPHPNCLCFTSTITVNSEDFINNLLGGSYDEWLSANGFTGFSAAA